MEEGAPSPAAPAGTVGKHPVIE